MLTETAVKAQKRLGVEMLVEGGRIKNAPNELSPIFEAEISQKRYCVIFVPQQHLLTIIESLAFPDKPFDLSDLGLAVAVGINGSFDLYPVTNGFKAKNNWLVSCEESSSEENAIAICFISNKHIIFPQKEEITNIAHSIFSP
jgi:hypothetical protein